MKKNVIIVNTSRGEVVNTPDLVDGLKSGKVFGAALDVFEGEKAFMFKDMTQKGFENHPELQVKCFLFPRLVKFPSTLHDVNTLNSIWVWIKCLICRTVQSISSFAILVQAKN